MFRKKSNLYHSFLLLKDFWVHGELRASLCQAQDEEFTAFSKMQLHPAKLWNAKNSHESTCTTCTLGILQALRQAYTCKAEVTTCPSATRVLWLWAHYTLQVPQKSHFPCEQLCPHTSSASKVCRGGLGTCQGLAGVFACQQSGLQCPSASQDGHPVLSFASGSFLRKGILHNASAAFWHRQGPGAFSHPPEVRQLRKLIQDRMRQCPPPGWKKACPTAGKRAGSIAQILGMSATAPLGWSALPCLSPPRRLRSLLSLVPGPAFKQQGPAAAWYGVRSARLLTAGFLGLCWDN